MSTDKRKIYLAGGCFWGLEKYLGSIPGVTGTEAGYANGRTNQPTYEAVCRQNTGHAETVSVEYDSSRISLSRLLALFYKVIDPTTLNRQGNDVGSQYRTGIYYTNQEDLSVIIQSLEQLQKNYKKPIAIEAKSLENYWPAEEYHQNYLDKNPRGYCHIRPEFFELAKSAVVDTGDYSPAAAEVLMETLSPLSYDVTMKNGTEPPYQNDFWNHFEEGIYVDITTGEPLFSSRDKFEACGWPSFTKPIDPESVTSKLDVSHGMVRNEVRSRVGGIHLGHVFEDGPFEEGGLRYCINSAALRFIPKERMKEEGYGKFLDRLKQK